MWQHASIRSGTWPNTSPSVSRPACRRQPKRSPWPASFGATTPGRVVAVSIPGLLAELRQAIEHIGRARAAMRTAVEEMTRAETLIRQALGVNTRDKSIYAAAKTRQALTEADQHAAATMDAANGWIARVQGRPSPGER